MKRLNQEQAETTAIMALQHIAEDPELLGRFLALTGSGPRDLRERASQPEFLGAVLDFVLGDDKLVIAIAERFEFAPDTPMRARLMLPGATLDV